MKSKYITEEYLDQFIEAAFKEDIGDGDHSTLATIPSTEIGASQLIIKEEGVLAGVGLAERIFHHFDKSLELEIFKKDGDFVHVGDIAFKVHGKVRSLLSTERLVLNCMQRLSGIATYTNHLVRKLEGTRTMLLDTRKTTPNLRPLEKWAVKVGGGENHRFALYDMVMLKDNHIDFSGGITKAVESTRAYLRENDLQLKIEVETRNLEEVQEALGANVDIIMLDNMDNETMRQAVGLVGGRAKTEASGGINEGNIAEVAKTGVDYISIGALTHSVKSLDMSLKAI